MKTERQIMQEIKILHGEIGAQKTIISKYVNIPSAESSAHIASAYSFINRLNSKIEALQWVLEK